jgi:hypothetical protein
MRIELFRVASLIIVSMWLSTSGLSFAGDPAKMLQKVRSDDQKYAGTWAGTFSPENGDSGGQLKYTFVKDEKGKWGGRVNYRDRSLDFKLLEIADGKMKAKVDLPNGEVEVILEGTFEGDNLEGTFALLPHGSTEAAGKGTWKVTRTEVKKPE